MAIVKKYPAKVVAIHNTIDGVYTLQLESLGKPFKYEPGQFMHLALDEYDPSGQWPESRCFSMQSSPDEELIRITYAVKGQFTNRMKQELKPGSVVTLKLPYGDLFLQPHTKENTVFIAGGTGITPFLSLFNHVSFTEYKKPVLYAGYRTKSYNLYQKELEIATSINPTFNIHEIYQDYDGLMEINRILENNFDATNYFISGPPDMIKIFKCKLMDKGVLNKDIFTDEWS